jgi:hypothetical protein
MKHKLSLCIAALALFGCSSNPNKAEKIQTKLDQPSNVTGGEKVGLKDGEMVVMDKVQIAEKLRDVQNAVYSLEDKVYGTRKLGSLGLYGELKACKRKLASKQYGGPGSMTWTEPLDRVTDKEEDLKIGLDEQRDLVGVTQEYLRDRLQRFQGYRQILQKRNDEFEEKIEDCKDQLGKKEVDASQSSKVLVSEAPKAIQDRAAINQFMCGFVRPGASLENFMINAFAHGWLALSDFQMNQNLLAGPVKDNKGEARENAFLFNGWKMAFDKGPVSVGEVLNSGKDAKLVAWSYDRKNDVPSASACLASGEGVWNH